jgi:hypothetical protein
MTPRFRAWAYYFVIFLPIAAGLGGLVGFATGRLAAWVAVGASLGVLLSVWLARTTPAEDNP